MKNLHYIDLFGKNVEVNQISWLPSSLFVQDNVGQIDYKTIANYMFNNPPDINAISPNKKFSEAKYSIYYEKEDLLKQYLEEILHQNIDLLLKCENKNTILYDPFFLQLIPHGLFPIKQNIITTKKSLNQAILTDYAELKELILTFTKLKDTLIICNRIFHDHIIQNTFVTNNQNLATIYSIFESLKLENVFLIF